MYNNATLGKFFATPRKKLRSAPASNLSQAAWLLKTVTAIITHIVFIFILRLRTLHKPVGAHKVKWLTVNLNIALVS